MNAPRYAGIVLCALIAVATRSSYAWELYRYRMPDGTVFYADEVSTRGKVEEVLREPLPGERRATAGGRTRLTGAYWARIRELRRAVQDARERLDSEYVARNDLNERPSNAGSA